MDVPQKFGLYAILTDPVKGYDYMTRLLVDHGVAFIQLRMKREPREVIFDTALRLRAIAAGSRSLFIINDHPDIAAAIGADGVHLGQNDATYAAARAMLGPDAIIGLSTHSPAQTLAACAHQPGYVGIGPVFPTPTKADPDPAIGITGMREMIGLATVPHVAIGGIDCTNLREVLDAGAINFCMVRQLMMADDPEDVLKTVARICADHGNFHTPE